MAGEPQPLSDKFQIVGPDGLPTLYFIQWAQQRQIDIGDSITLEQAHELIDQFAAARQIIAGRALDGGGFLSSDVTIDHAESLVVPGTYGDATNVPQFVVDQEGHIQGVVLVPVSAGGTVSWGDILGVLSDQTDLQVALDAKAKLAGGNVFTGDQEIDGNLVMPPGNFAALGHNIELIGNGPFGFTAFQFVSNNLSDRAIIWGGHDTDNKCYFDADRLLIEDLAEANIYADFQATLIKLKINNIDRLSLDATEAAFSYDVTVPDEAYGVGWDGSLEVPTKNAIYDKIETISSSPVLTIVPVAGTTYTIAATDNLHHLRFANAAAVACTVPTNATAAFPIGGRVRMTQVGAGTVTLVPAGGVTLNSRGAALASAGQFAVFEIEKVAADEWDVLGDVA